ncbi:hypothetical protein LA080_007366 [Diaporthe eres]|nr:hypothetical protein LA080_007366 [Diaporthe eres]
MRSFGTDILALTVSLLEICLPHRAGVRANAHLSRGNKRIVNCPSLIESHQIACMLSAFGLHIRDILSNFGKSKRPARFQILEGLFVSLFDPHEVNRYTCSRLIDIALADVLVCMLCDLLHKTEIAQLGVFSSVIIHRESQSVVMFDIDFESIPELF